MTSTLEPLAFVAVVLSSLGIYGVVAYSVAKRRSEIALRMAPRADKWTILRFVVLKGMRPVSVGILAGLMVIWSLNDQIAELLYGDSLRVWTVYLFVTICTLLASLLANAVPAIRAAKTDSLTAMRNV